MNSWVEVDVRRPTTTNHERPMRPYSPGFWINYQHHHHHPYYHRHSSSSSNHNYHRFKICFHPISTYHPFPVVVRPPPPPPKREYPLLTTRTRTMTTTRYPVRNVVPIGISWRVSYPSRTCFTDPPPIKTATTTTTNTTMKNYHFQRNNRTL